MQNGHAPRQQQFHQRSDGGVSNASSHSLCNGRNPLLHLSAVDVQAAAILKVTEQSILMQRAASVGDDHWRSAVHLEGYCRQ